VSPRRQAVSPRKLPVSPQRQRLRQR